jgi:hypothetical protein
VAILAAFTTLWLLILTGLLIVYIGIYLYWMIKVEIPQYDHGYVEYDSIWFEGGATRTGTKIVDWLENN